MSGKIQNGKYVQVNWIYEMTETLARLHPEMDRSAVEDFVIEQFNEHYTDHEAMLYNSYENTVAKTTLGQVCDWIQKEKPLIAESGVFFYPKHIRRNVNTEIIKECMLDARTIHKAEKFQAMDAGDVFTAAVKDIQQANDKKAANSGYGAEGQSSSFLFNVHSAMSVTACGRGQLSTAINCFENLFGDFVKFFNMDEFHTMINHVISEKKDWKYDTFEIIRKVPSEKSWVRRFAGKFLHPSLCDEDQLARTYRGLNDEMRIRTYYKSNLREFLWRNRIPQDIFTDIADEDVEFIDPNKIPKEIKDDVKELGKLVTEFVVYKYSWFRYEDRARYQKRSTIIVADTDSCFIHYSPILKFVMGGKVLPMRLFRKEEDFKLYKIKIMNVLSCCASEAIAATLWNYLGYANVAEEDRPHIKMKNEFYYERVIVTYAKKSYIGLLTRQESVVLKKPKMDVKGVNFFKSTASEKTSAFIYQDVLMDQLLKPKDGTISLRRTYKVISDFQKQIAKDVKAGDMGFLKRSIRVKSADAYNDPLRQSQYRATYVWNYVNDDKDRIELPATTTLVKVKLRDKKDVAALAPWPKIYERMMKLFETNENFGDYTVIKDGKEKLVKGRGVTAIALPNELDEVPEWVLAIIDVETLVSDNIKLFTQLFRPLGLSDGSTAVNKATARYYLNVMRI